MDTPPTVAVLAGINGAGKTTASQRVFRPGGLRVPIFVNADTIARGLNALDVDSMAGKAGRIMLEHLHELADQKKSFAFETTLAARTYAPWLGKLKDDGYIVHLLYYWLRSADLAVERVAHRVRSGGHDIPVETVRRRYSRSVHNFLHLYRPVATTWQVFDNSEWRSELIAHNNSYFDTIADPDRWDLFQRSADNDDGDAAGG